MTKPLFSTADEARLNAETSLNSTLQRSASSPIDDWPKTPEPTARILQLRLHHFFVWTAVSAALFARIGPQISGLTLPDSSPMMRTLVVGNELIYVLIDAAVLTTVGYCLAWWLRGAAIFHQPGHWLLAVLAAAVITSLANGFLMRWWYTSQSYYLPLRYAVRILLLVPNLLYSFGPWILSIYVGIKKCSERHWKWVFFATSAVGILTWLVPWLQAVWLSAGSSSSTFAYYFNSIAFKIFLLIVLAFAVKRDRQRRVPRDSIHRCGVALYAAQQLASLVLMLVWWLLS